MSRLSVVVTTFNNADTIGRCLSSIAGLADDLLVLDSFSTDSTVAIASTGQARIEQQAFAGFGPQKQRAIALAAHDWVLLLDADEALSPALLEHLKKLKKAGFNGAGYRLRRREWLARKTPLESHGRWQRRGVKLTDHLRLFARNQIRFSDHPVHAAPLSHQPTPLLSPELLHWGDAPFSRRRQKARDYATLNARHGKNNPTVWLHVKQWLSPAWAFLQDYFLRRYYLDGLLGLEAAYCSAYARWMHYRALLKCR